MSTLQARTTERVRSSRGWAVSLARFTLCLGLLPFVHVERSLPPDPPAAATSTPQCRERSGVIGHTHVASAVYGADVPISIYVPPCYRAADAGLPVVYLLHGGNADETQWPDVGVQAAADALIAQGSSPFIVVMPGGDYSAKLDYGAFVLSDLLPAMQQQFHTAPTRSARAIGGISLGGYWALSLALAHPEVFAAVGGHSPVVRLGRATDPLAQAQTAQGLDQLRMSLDVGDADALRADISRMVQVLQARGVAVDFGVFQGRHDRSYWRSRTPAYLRFYVDAFDAAAHASATATPTAAPSTHPGAACSTDRAHP